MIEYASSPSTPGCVLKPGDTESRQFTPSGHFIVFLSGTLTNEIVVCGIPQQILEDDDIADFDPYWEILEPGLILSKNNMNAGFVAYKGITVDLRGMTADDACYAFWGYAYTPVWGAKLGGL